MIHVTGLKPSASSSDLWCWREFDGAWWVHGRGEENRNVVATPSGWRRSWCRVSNMHSTTGQAQSTYAGTTQSSADAMGEYCGSWLREGYFHWIQTAQREMNWWSRCEYMLTVRPGRGLPRFTPPRATACVSLGALGRWSERAVWGHCGEGTASMSSKSHQSLPLSSWPMNRYATQQLQRAQYFSHILCCVTKKGMTCLSDQTINWKQPGDVGHRRETGGRLSGWSNRSEQHLPHGGESPLNTNRMQKARKKTTLVSQVVFIL